jgi:hypothetical protein
MRRGANQDLPNPEALPVGNKLAFDEAKMAHEIGELPAETPA